MKKILCVFLVLAAAACGADETCPSCGDEASLYEGEDVSGEYAAGMLTIEKTAPERIVKGDVLPVTIYITNGLSAPVMVDLKETFGGAEEVDMDGFVRNTEEKIISAPPYYTVSLKVAGNSAKSATYRIRPLYFGRFKIPATKVQTASGTFESNSLTVLVECNGNGVCETAEDENALTCPQDCSPKKKDELCNPVLDGVCDPDCPEGEDPDCSAAGTSTTSCVTTSTAPAMFCGDGICSSGENYGNCPKDCPSGSGDGFCDGVKDGVCDPDCDAGSDEDCKSPTGGLLLVILLFILILIVIVIAYKKRCSGET